MKKLNLDPSNYTTDEIYTAFEFLNSSINTEQLDKLRDLNKMYELIQKDLSKLDIKFFSYLFLEHSFHLRFEKSTGQITIVKPEKTWNLSSAPKEYRLLIEKLLPTFIRSIADSLGLQ